MGGKGVWYVDAAARPIANDWAIGRGAPGFRFGDLAADLDLITEARRAAAKQLG